MTTTAFLTFPWILCRAADDDDSIDCFTGLHFGILSHEHDLARPVLGGVRRTADGPFVEDSAGAGPAETICRILRTDLGAGAGRAAGSRRRREHEQSRFEFFHRTLFVWGGESQIDAAGRQAQGIAERQGRRAGDEKTGAELFRTRIPESMRASNVFPTGQAGKAVPIRARRTGSRRMRQGRAARQMPANSATRRRRTPSATPGATSARSADTKEARAPLDGRHHPGRERSRRGQFPQIVQSPADGGLQLLS